ncbi:hypothetical protein E6C76_11435 [Pseudothauera nasutitermitis]|uniref:Uncharacterized protein n=1 Tax=Pseudothauera nasutitermitis TaxID=2565930 RepID=A0A4S4AXK8_9RHOO|nr:hypothetical protein [Pseudothauera nasutitermitis]THF64660.1 hypothetical protein E6C76_11435 [Pseudothauera nasutitermitis]
MQPSIPIPTDNIYKFACLFGLALIVSAIFSFVLVYSSSFDRKVKYSESIIPLEAKADRTKTEEDLLALNKKLIEVTLSNESTASHVIAVTLTFGIAFSVFGATRWHQTVQQRDDQLAELQLRKITAEVAILEGEAAAKNKPPNNG